jgi:3-oxoacyl-[acyl-carrier-protein] synthase III
MTGWVGETTPDWQRFNQAAALAILQQAGIDVDELDLVVPTTSRLDVDTSESEIFSAEALASALGRGGHSI